MCEKRGGEFSWEAVVVGFGVLGRGQGRDRTFHGSNTVKILIVLVFVYVYICICFMKCVCLTVFLLCLIYLCTENTLSVISILSETLYFERLGSI